MFDQMEKVSLQKQALEDEVRALKTKSGQDQVSVEVKDFEVFRQTINKLLEQESDPEVKTKIIQKVIQKIIIRNEEVGG
ncbi:MAG: hypothetical protein ACK5P7_08790 [Bdellovibrio sp.]